MKKRSFGHKFLHFPLTKIIIGIVVILGVYAGAILLFSELFKSSSMSEELNEVITVVISAVFALIAYYFLFKFYEKRKITELSTKGMGRSLVIGLLLGVVLQSLTILVIYLNGGFTVVSVNSFLFLVPAFIMAFSSAIFEEIIIRGVLFRIIEEKLGSYLALLISALIFGALHLANPNSSLITALGLAIQAGLLLAVAFIYTRNLWFPIAIHFAWNFTQGGIFGANVSGGSVGKSLLTTKIQGAQWLTGGEFGPEGSIQATLFCLIATIVLLILCHKRNRLIKPYWKKK